MKKTLIALTLLSASTSLTAFAGETEQEIKQESQQEFSKHHTDSKPVLIGVSSGAIMGGVIAGPPGAIIGGLLGIFIGQDHNDQKEIAYLNTSLNETQSSLSEEQQALIAANHSIEQYQLALNEADNAIRQAKLSELVTQVQFKTGDAAVSPVFHQHLDKLAGVMGEDDSLQLDIQGYADVRGDEAYNQDLSEKRANNIKDYLVSAGIDSNRLSVAAHGESASIGDDYEEHFFDRKVVMTLSSEPETFTVKR